MSLVRSGCGAFGLGCGPQGSGCTASGLELRRGKALMCDAELVVHGDMAWVREAGIGV